MGLLLGVLKRLCWMIGAWRGNEDRWSGSNRTKGFGAIKGLRKPTRNYVSGLHCSSGHSYSLLSCCVRTVFCLHVHRSQPDLHVTLLCSVRTIRSLHEVPKLLLVCTTTGEGHFLQPWKNVGDEKLIYSMTEARRRILILFRTRFCTMKLDYIACLDRYAMHRRLLRQHSTFPRH